MAQQHHEKHFSALKAFVAFLVIAVSCSVLLLFTSYKESIIASGNFHLFITLTTGVSALLLTLLYLVNKSQHKPHASSTHQRRR